MKLIAPGSDVDADLKLVRSVRSVLPPHVQLAVDVHGAFADVRSAIAYGAKLEHEGLRFLEDPFPSWQVSQVVSVAAALKLPIAAGEDLISPDSYTQLLAGGVSYLRADATATGGYGSAMDGIRAAEAVGASVAPHVWPHIHMPLASLSSSVVAIEVIPSYVGADPIDTLLVEPMPISGGAWVAPRQDGLYLPFDWELVAKSSNDRFRWDAA